MPGQLCPASGFVASFVTRVHPSSEIAAGSALERTRSPVGNLVIAW